MFKVVLEVPKPLLIFLNSYLFILFWLDVSFFLLFQIIDLSPGFLPFTVGSLYIFLYFTLHSLHFFLYFVSILKSFLWASWLLVFWTLHLICWLSPPHLVLFLEFDLFFHLGHISLSLCTPYIIRCGALSIHQGGANHFAALSVGEGPEREQCQFLGSCPAFSHFPAIHKQTGPSDFRVGGLGYVLWPCGPLQQILGVSPTTATPTGFYSQTFWGFSSQCWNPGLCCLPRSPVVPSGLSTDECGTTRSASYRLTQPGLSPCCMCSLSLLQVWMNMSFLTPWLSDFHTVWLSGRPGWFLFLNWLSSFFWLCEEAKHICPRLHLGHESPLFTFF